MADGTRAKPPPHLSVFLNCPFDDDYKPIFDVIVFTVVMCGHTPRCALELDNAVQNRLDKIQNLIAECPLGIHDLSRTEPSGPNGLPRFNMPLELGLFLGAARYGTVRQRRKQCLILDSEPCRYLEFISDIRGQDIAPHGGSPANAVSAVRNFLATATGSQPPGGKAIISFREEFHSSLPQILRDARLEAAEMTFSDLTRILFRWARSRAYL